MQQGQGHVGGPPQAQAAAGTARSPFAAGTYMSSISDAFPTWNSPGGGQVGDGLAAGLVWGGEVLA